MVTFPGDPPFETRPFFQTSKGDLFNLARLTMGTNIGTHVDPPAHYLDGGKPVDRIPLDILIGPGVVLDMRDRDSIDRQAAENSPLENHIKVLLKTDNSSRLPESTFHEDFVHLTEEGASYLVERGACLVGIDYLSIEHYKNPGVPVHHILLNACILIVEGVHLMDIPPGRYEIFCLPPRLKGADGAPARLILQG